MEDLNNMSMEDLVRFAEKGVLPDNINTEVPPDIAADDDVDMNAMSPEQLLAMAEGNANESTPAEPSIEEPVEEAEPEEASAAELLAMLGDTVGEDELDGSSEEELKEIGKNIEKIKLRELANKLGTLAPANLFPPKKDEIYYFLSSMVGQSQKIRIEDAKQKCAFIGKALSELETYMISEVGLSMDESAMIISSFETFAKETVSETESRNLVIEQFRFGWKQTLKKTQRDFENLKKFARQKEKPLWVLFMFYESLSRSYGLCRASDNLKDHADEVGSVMKKEEKREIVDLFEEIVELAPFYGLKSISFINRKQAYEAVGALDLEGILEKLKKLRSRA
jgi:ribosomal 50S subunit-associated protein YjgA (DUF615 family)